MKCVVLDLEFTDLVPDEDSDFEANPSLQIACAATVLSDPGSQPIVWKPDPNDSKLMPHLIQGLLYYIQSIVAAGYTLVTWGGMSSDFRMLQKACPSHKGLIQNLALESIDIPQISACVQGMMMSLQSVADALQLSSKAFDSREIPKMWNAGLQDEVQSHVSQDVLLTLQVWQQTLNHGVLQWKTRRGLIRKWKFNFLTIGQCLQLPVPDVPFEISRSMDPKQQARWIRTEYK